MIDPIETPIGTVTPEHFRPGSTRHRVFVGPKFAFALFNPGDRLHPVSKAFMSYLRIGELPYRRLVVDEHVLDEAATRLKKRASMQHAEAFLTTVRESNLYRIRPTTEDVLSASIDRFLEWTDFGGSFTDVSIATHMATLEIDHVLTYDRHLAAFDVTTLPYGTWQGRG